MYAGDSFSIADQSCKPCWPSESVEEPEEDCREFLIFVARLFCLIERISREISGDLNCRKVTKRKNGQKKSAGDIFLFRADSNLFLLAPFSFLRQTFLYSVLIRGWPWKILISFLLFPPQVSRGLGALQEPRKYTMLEVDYVLRKLLVLFNIFSKIYILRMLLLV